MYLSNRLYFFTALVLLGIVACLIIGIPLSGAASSKMPTDKGDVVKFLTDVNDHTAIYIISSALSILLDTVFAPLIGVLLYVAFRDRSRVLALTLFAGFISQSAVSVIADVIGAAFVPLAKDFVNGGAGVNAGDVSTLELAHTLAWIQQLLEGASGTTLAVAFLALGWLIARAPRGNVNPPVALGWLAVVAGVLTVLSWGGAAVDVIGILGLLGLVLTLVFTLWLGIWFLLRGSSLPAPAP